MFSTMRLNAAIIVAFGSWNGALRMPACCSDTIVT